jgi:hypothetical protein
MKFWYGSRFADPYLRIPDADSDPDPDADTDPAIFVSDLQAVCLLPFEGTFTSIFKDKKS